ncbi:bifunctional phosphoribosylaminoimidazolecarboxamide formyltransferase/IMP cyclohydrolase [Geminicoccaceae bacterium 1502E]|nr:bifunctional phosphoribosylaminoimidazolecarboxamide formyltransferase/IMP cyclohydrolase [Geminicoccaceae bacterium 1502E]
MTFRPIRRALLSAHDKTGILELARALASRGVELLSTGGTAAMLRQGGLAVTEVSEVTGAAEILDGRVKTLHPAIHGGLLARRDDPAHMKVIEEQGIAPIDLLVVNLYPFEATLASGASFADCIEKIDVGGPAMLRGAAKNHEGVAVLVDPADYPALLAELDATGGTSLALRRHLAARTFALTASYDAAIASWMAGLEGELLPERLTLAGQRRLRLRYGENPHQEAAFYVSGEARPGVATAEQLQGKELSYNNLLDTDAAFELVAEFDEPACAIIKHTNPCGVAVGADPAAAWAKALACDPVSAFGGIVALNRELDEATAAAIAEIFVEVVIAPSVSLAAARLLATKKNLRLLATGAMPARARGLTVRSLAGGFLAQERDVAAVDEAALRTVTSRAPDQRERADLLFAWKVVKHVKSNAIVLARDGAAVGIGMGQTNRVDSVRIAAERMRKGPGAGPCVVASDAFFPFADGLEEALAAGATAAIQPGGSVRDEEVIAAADAAGAAMLLTGMRHFRH